MSKQIDRSAIPRSYRDYLEWMQREGEFLAIDDEVDWHLEMGAILQRAPETLSPSPIFNKVKDCPGFRAAEFGMQKSGTPGRPWARLASFLGLPLDSHVMEMQAAYNEAMEKGTVHPPKIVESKDAPCKENIWMGDDIDLEKIPAPLLHMGDGQRMMQSCGLNIVRTPDGKWTNWSTNRSALIDKKTMAGFWLPVQHNGLIFEMWKKEKGEDMPVAIAFGVPPACAVHAGSRIPDWEDEYDYASKLLDAPIEMIKCETNDLLVPAESEIVIEGTISITETCLEGPFGEWAGYIMASKVEPKPKHTVTAVTFRNNGILPISSPGVPPNSTQISIAFFCSADYVRRLKEAGFPIVDGLQTFESAGHWFVLRVKNNWHQLTGWSHSDFMNRLGNFIWKEHIGFGIGKIIVVGEDIDPTDPLAVTWAFASRNHPDPGMGFFQFPEIKSFGFGVDGYHSTEDFHSGKGGFGIYSCIGLEELTGLPKPGILTFNRGWPKAIKERVLANWERWGFHTPDPNSLKHATPSTPWAYFNTTGEGETGRGENL
jgi:4-hydroxy-3-polyprenylbenzoate decarboxylase